MKEKRKNQTKIDSKYVEKYNGIGSTYFSSLISIYCFYFDSDNL